MFALPFLAGPFGKLILYGALGLAVTLGTGYLIYSIRDGGRREEIASQMVKALAHQKQVLDRSRTVETEVLLAPDPQKQLEDNWTRP